MLQYAGTRMRDQITWQPVRALDAVGGALIAMRMRDPVQGLAVTALCGALTGFATLILWLRYLRQTPEAREVLAVTEDGTPDTVDLGLPARGE